MRKRKILSALLTLIMVLTAADVSAQGKKVTMNLKDVALPTALRQVEQQSGYYKMNYAYDEVSRFKVTVNIKNATAPEAVKQLLKGLPFTSSVNGQFIQIKRSEMAAGQASGKKVVKGKLYDSAGEPLIGATVQVEGTQKGTVTDADGNFRLDDVNEGETLVFSYVGKQTLKRKATNKPIAIILEDESFTFDEVVVTGYQNIKRENATGSYQLISSKKLDEHHTGTIVENLEGKIPGLMSYNNGMNGGGENALTIRGISSFQARTNPLVVVDGLPIEGSIETVNPYEIENITVLKDASAAAIYGARASNGVIVITTKQAHQEKLDINFDTDITISEKQNYDNYGWANAEEYIALEKYNFNHMKANDENSFTSVAERYRSNPSALTPVMRMLIANHLGEMSDASLQSTLNSMSKNDYRKEWMDAKTRARVLQQYNLALRTRGKYLSSSIVLNYKSDNLAKKMEHNNVITFSYRGDLNPTKWLNLAFGANFISERQKNLAADEKGGINAYQPYMSMYNADGSRARMDGRVLLTEPALQNPDYGLKDLGYNPLDEMGPNTVNTRDTHIRTFGSATVTLLPGWTASAHFQYEDSFNKSNTYLTPDSYAMRYLYDIYTTESNGSVTHNIPEGGLLTTTNTEGAHYTFRAQTGYSREIAEKHGIEAVAGFEFRESHAKTYGNVILGYDDQTQSNRSNTVNYGVLKNLYGKASVLGDNYAIYDSPSEGNIATSDILHRFYSLYFSGIYTYDHRYSASLSYRVDKTDLFGADPEFRGRPLWSAGLSWNIHNEEFMKAYPWIDVLKLRTSYGLTGNIDSSVSSYLTATLDNEYLYANVGATLDTPPNEQLRWEKTSSWNVGVDFSLWNNRLSGSLDLYHKKGTDLLTLTDLDITTGWSSLTINNGEMKNHGVELQLNGQILKPATRNDLGINASFNIAYNKNKVTKVTHKPTSGYVNLQEQTLHEGYPVHSIFSYRFAGIENDNNIQTITWYDHEGEVNKSNLTSSSFTPEDGVYCGSLDPKVMSSFTPEITWRGFSLSAMFSYYGGHHMRANVQRWSSQGSVNGYSGAIFADNLNFWTTGDATQYLGNGYLGGTAHIPSVVFNRFMDANVVPADYMKLRNLVLGYEFPKTICHSLKVNSIRLRLQMNNLCTWVRNDLGIDPEANSPVGGTPLNKTPKSYTMSLRVNF